MPRRNQGRPDTTRSWSTPCTTPTTTTQATETLSGTGPPCPLERRRTGSGDTGFGLALAGAAALIAVIVGVVVLVQPDKAVTPVAAVTAAADKTGDESTLRVRATYDSGNGYRTELSGEIDGADSRSRSSQTGPDGEASTSSSRTAIGDRLWETDDDGVTTSSTFRPEEGNAPYPEASRAVVTAALQGSTVDRLGREDVTGVEATHYQITLGPTGVAALAALTPSQLAAFELEYPGEVEELEVWVADDLIRRIHVRSDFEASDAPGSVIEFYDFGADISITPPT